MISLQRYFILIVFFIVATIPFACHSTKHANIKHGADYNFKAGYPEFRISTFGYIDEEKEPRLTMTAGIVKGSLIYKKKGDSLSAKIAVDYQIIDLDDSENIISSKHYKKTITSNSNRINSSRETVKLEHTLQVPPSNYKVIISVKDLSSGKEITQQSETYIPNTNTGAYSLSSIQLYGKVNSADNWTPINTYDVKGKIDSLRFVLQVISPESEQRMKLNSKLLSFESDTSYPRPMHYADYSTSTIGYKGIDYDEETELRSNQRILTDYSSVFIEYKYALPERGNYRLEITAQKANQEEVYKARDFGVKSKNYPSIKSTRELARPLIYLMDEKKYKELLAITNRDSLKKEIDRFWLKNVGNAHRAGKVIEKYYQRVEEANKQFSNFKEGWKTDRGMIFILFGRPWYIDQKLRDMYWSYSYNREDPEKNFYFTQPKFVSKFFPFEHYLLRRSNSYFNVQYRQVELWRSGLILRRNF